MQKNKLLNKLYNITDLFKLKLIIKIASKDNKDILDLLGINDGNQIVSCLVIGYPNVKYQRTVPRKKASINWI